MTSHVLPLTFYPKKTASVLLLLMSLAFIAGGVWMALRGDRIGWFCAGFFALGIPVFLLQFHPRATFLTITEDGFMFSALFRRTFVRWADVESFGVYTIRQTGIKVSTLVGFNYVRDFQQFAKGRALSKSLSGFEAGLPDTYGFKAEELALLLSDIQKQSRAKDLMP